MISRKLHLSRPRPGAWLLALLAAAALLLAGCESSEERAERHFSSGMALLAEGDVTQALLELRNTIRLRPEHIEARLAIAGAERGRGNIGAAFREYLQVAERDPDIFEARLALAQIALEGGDWETAERHGRAAEGLSPEDPEAQIVGAVLDYRDAVREDDRAAADAPAELLAGMIEDHAGSVMAWRMMIDHALDRGQRLERGLTRVEQALQHHPDVIDFHELKLRLQAELGRTEDLRGTLETMLATFPDNTDVLRLMISYLMEQDAAGDAEAILRARADAPEAAHADVRRLLEFLERTAGGDAVLEELDARLAAAEGPELRLEGLRAQVLQARGARDAAIAGLAAALDGVEASDEANETRVQLARMLEAAGDSDGARALVDTVLEADSGQVEALKMRAAWLIAEDAPAQAIAALRQAQSGAPRDPTIMMMMGQAHERDGDRDLAGERYAQAVDMSGEAPRESLLFARFLLREGRTESAEAVLTSALRNAPANPALLHAMGEVQLRLSDWDRAQRLVWQLRALDTPEATRAANALEAEALNRQGRTEETIGFLQQLVEQGDDQTAALAALVQAQVRQGELSGAVDLVDARLQARPDDPALRFLRAGLMVLEGRLPEAEDVYRTMLEEFPGAEPPLRVLHGLLLAQGRTDEAAELIDAAIEAAPGAVLPRVIRASRLERERDYEGAIAIYEELYAADSGNQLLANNLASLIATHRPDAESLERAEAIARRLRGTDVPAFQDTFGWIQHRRGNYDTALRYLEPAAAALRDDPFVQYHLGMTYHALGRLGDARSQFERALEIAGDTDLPQFAEARRLLAEIAGN